MEIGGISRKYNKIPQYERQLKTDNPTTISLTVEYDDDNLIDFWDVIEIKKNGVSEWKGFVEGIKITWDEDGIYYALTGRDSSLILWKKFNENFVNMHEGTNGFFGQVNATELVRFLLRCPKSDPVNTYPNNKSGWGIDASRILSVQAFYADLTKKSYGDPEWTFLRKRGLGWKNNGELSNVDLDTNAIGTVQWETHGSSPYLSDEDDINYIKSHGILDEYATFRLDNLTNDATTLKDVKLVVAWRPDDSWWNWIKSDCYVYLSKDGGTEWTFIGNFQGKGAVFWTEEWWHYVFPIPLTFFSSLDDLRNDNLWVKFVNKSTSLATNITKVHLSVIYEEHGTQAIGDEIDIVFETDTITGLYMESRADEQSYPRNYGIVKVTDTPQDYTSYTEVDPNTHISKAASHIDFDGYQNEDAYVYKNFGAGYFVGYFDHFFKVKVVTDPMLENRVVPIWALANAVDDYTALATNGNNLAMTVQYGVGWGGPKFTLRAVHGGVAQGVDLSEILTEGETYNIHVKRIAGNIRAYIYDSNGLFDVLEITMVGTTDTYQYLFACLTANNGVAGHTDIDLDELIIQTYVSLTYKNDSIYRDVIASWTPQEMNHIRIRISDSENFSWGVTQIYLYAADEVDYRVWYEGGILPTFALNQYIQTVTFDSTYAPAIGPLNISEGRLLNTIYNLVKQLNDEYVPYDVWMDMDDDNTLHIKDERGTDKSATVNFQLALNLEGNSYSKSVDESVQRLKISASGEGKDNDKNSSDWVTNIPAEIHTFYEDIVSKKDVSDYSVAMSLAQIALLESKIPKEQIRFKVSKDDYPAMTYDVGDTVTITDSLIGLAVATKIYNISKSVDGNGEQIIVTCGAPYEDVEEIWKDIYERLKTLERVGVVKPDWTADSVESAKIDPNKLDTMFEATGHNDEISTGSKTDPQWWLRWTGYAGARGHLIGSATPTHGMKFDLKGDAGVIQGPSDDASTYYILAERRYDDIGDGNDEFHDVPINLNPKMEFELKLFEITEGTPQFWNEDDILDIGFKKWGEDPDNPLDGTGYWFRIIALGDSQFEVYAMWTGNSQKLIIPLLSNKRYRFEIIADKDRQQIVFNVYDIDLSPDFPYSVVRMGADINEIIRPFHACMVANHNNQYVAVAYFYRVKIEYKRVGV